MDDAEIAEIYAVRELLECEALRRSVPALSSGKLKEAEQALPVSIFSLTDRGDIFAGAALTMILVAAMLVLLLGLERITKRATGAWRTLRQAGWRSTM
ncbi:hypothetical protein NKI12_05515 [Mesorhizobium australicum]|uniref:Uncharacterized protein n=1 Tax=Mesorhizobium australicum TaxID=536018 RepID=A0ACC6SSG2_9HYPH